jgi:hypothetical protein
MSSADMELGSANMELGRADMEPTITSIIAKINDLQRRIINYASDNSTTPLIMRSSSDKIIIDNYNINLTDEAKNIRDLILVLEPKREDNYTTMQNWAPILLTQLNKMMRQYDLVKNTVHSDPLDGPNEVAQIKINTNFYAYVLSGLCAIFVLGALIHIFKNPEVENLDMFILVLAVIILAYYGYDYFYVKKSAAGSSAVSNVGATSNYITNYLSRLF